VFILALTHLLLLWYFGLILFGVAGTMGIAAAVGCVAGGGLGYTLAIAATPGMPDSSIQS
jgi:hypothetical protein